MLQIETPYLTLAVNTRSIYVNRNIIKIYESLQEAIASQFMLHFVLNLDYGNSKPHFYTFIEMLCGMRSAADVTKENKTLKSFLEIFETNLR